MLDLVWDMETNDPDDFLTLLLLLGHPQVNLKAVTVVPGSAAQIGVVQHAIRVWFGRDIPVGAYNIDHEKTCISPWHYESYGPIPPSRDAVPAPELLRHVCDEQTTLLTGGPLKNLGAVLRGEAPFSLGRWVAQGGFAGEGVVPLEQQLEKFKGMTTAPTYNLNGDPKSALLALGSPAIDTRYFVSKNVCHGVYYDQSMHEHFTELKSESLSLSLIWRGMEHYLRRDPTGKKFHDPLAACCAIDPSIGTWAEVELYRERGQWGSRPVPGSQCWIITDYDRGKFVEVLTAH